MRWIKTFESYNNQQEYVNDVISLLGNYNITPIQIQKVIDFYADQIINYYNDGKHPKLFVDEIVKQMELDKGGFFSQRMSGVWQSGLKYL